MKKNVKLRPVKGNLVVPKELNKIFPIECFNSQQGIIKVGENEYSICAVFKSIISHSNVQEIEVLKRYIFLLNDISTSVQLYFSNHSLEKYNLYENINLNVDEKNERISYIILSTKAGSFDEAANKLYAEMKRVNEIFRVKLLSIEEYINVIYLFYNPGDKIAKGFLTDLFLKGIHINDIFNAGDPEFEKSHLQIGDTYLKYFYIRELPELIGKNYITELFKLEFEIAMSIHIDLLDTEKVDAILNEKFIKMKESMKTDEFIPFEITRNEDEIANRRKYNSIDKVFNVGMYIGTMANDLETLESRSNTIMNICKRYNSNAEVLTYQTENSLASLMPIGCDKVNIRRLLKTSDLIKLIYI